MLLQEAKTHQDKPKQTVTGDVDLGISYPIAPAEDSRFFQLEGRYIADLVTDESYGIYPGGEQLAARICAYLPIPDTFSLRQTTNATGGYLGPYRQYEVVSQTHVVDLAAEEPPEIAILSKTEVESGISRVGRIAFPRETV